MNERSTRAAARRAQQASTAARRAATSPLHAEEVTRSVDLAHRLLTAGTRLPAVVEALWARGYRACEADRTGGAADTDLVDAEDIAEIHRYVIEMQNDAVPGPVVWAEVWRSGYRAAYMDLTGPGTLAESSLIQSLGRLRLARAA